MEKPNSRRIQRNLNYFIVQQQKVNESINTLRENDHQLYNYIDNLKVFDAYTNEEIEVLVTVQIGSPSDPERSTGFGRPLADAVTLHTDNGPIVRYDNPLEGPVGGVSPKNRKGDIGLDIVLFQLSGDPDSHLANEAGDVMYRMEYPIKAAQERGNRYQTDEEYPNTGSGAYSNEVQKLYRERKISGSGKSGGENPYPVKSNKK